MQFPEQEQLKCPRCESTNTKFCYYNNYNLSQPRHFCKNCRRYWTKGGALRNIPVGGGTRKNSKRAAAPTTAATATAKRSSSSSSATSMVNAVTGTADPDLDPTRALSHGLDIPGSFSSLLGSNGPFGGLFVGVDPNPDLKMAEFAADLGSGSGRKSGPEAPSAAASESYWGGGNGWPDLAIYTPGSSYQ